MSESNNHIAHLSLQQIKDYLAGRLGEKESYQMEKHLQECDLCAEAMLGMEKMDARIIGEDVSHLKSLVAEKTKARSRTSWTVRIAAAIILLAISSYLAINYFQVTDRDPIIASEETENDLQDRENAFAKNDSIQETDKPGLAEDMEIAMSQAEEREQTSLENEIDTNAGAGPVQTDPEVAQTETEVVEETLAEEILISEEEPELVVEQKLETIKEKLATEDAVSRQPASKSAARSLSDQSVEAAPELNALSGYAANEGTLIIRVIQGNENPDKNAEPDPGTIEYINQVLKDLQYPEKASGSGIIGHVTLTFQVAESGLLSDFRITKGLGYGCDEEAIRVIKTGPGWNSAILKGKPVSQQIEIMVPFPKSGN